MNKKALLSILLVLLLALNSCGQAKPNTGNKTNEANDITKAPESVTKAPSPIATPGKDNNDSTPNEEDKMESLKEIYKEYGLKAGTCLTTAMISNKDTEELIKSQFNSVTFENDMKPDYILDKQASVDSKELTVKFNSNMLKLLKWAKDNNMAVRGHTIIWHSQTPEWIFHEDFDVNKPFAGRETMLTRMESFIHQIFEKLEEEGYSDIIYAYDIVNEAWMEDGKLRTDKAYWLQTIGEDYLWQAFNFANKYAPESIDLYYNDYNEQYKSDALVKFVNTLVDEDGNYLIDGIGLQAHLYTCDDINTYLKAVDKLAATGLKIQITELDVSLGTWQKELPASEENFKVQGQYYYELISSFLEKVKAGTVSSDALTFWGFNDDMSWRKSASPLLYNKDGSKKPAYYGAALLKEDV